jgi:hypothetical protein
LTERLKVEVIVPELVCYYQGKSRQESISKDRFRSFGDTKDEGSRKGAKEGRKDVEC